MNVKFIFWGVEEVKMYIISDYYQDYFVVFLVWVVQKICFGDIYFMFECLIYVEFLFVFDLGIKRLIIVFVV